MKKYLRLFLVFFRINWMQEAEYRFNLVINSLMNIGWAGIFLLFAQVIFGHVENIAGWSKPEVIFLAITQTLAYGLLGYCFFPGLNTLSYGINRGELDLLLTKPISARYMTIISNQNMDMLLRIPVLTIVAYFWSINLNPQLPFVLFILYLVALIIGILVLYNVLFMIHCLSFWTNSLPNLGHLSSTLTDVAQYPPSAFQPAVRTFLFYLIPTIFIAYVPVKISTGEQTIPLLLGVLLAWGVSHIASQTFWKKALRHYSSASS